MDTFCNYQISNPKRRTRIKQKNNINMKSLLIKKAKGWYNLYDNKVGIGSTHEALQGQKLSIKNCDEIFGVFDVEKMAEEYATSTTFIKKGEVPTYKEIEDAENISEIAFIVGFNKALDMNKEKVFTLEQVHKLLRLVHTLPNRDFEFYEDETNVLQIDAFISAHIQEPRETEIEVEVEMDNGSDELYAFPVPKFDEDGCLILKKIQQ
jgi:hypothetical protein